MEINEIRYVLYAIGYDYDYEHILSKSLHKVKGSWPMPKSAKLNNHDKDISTCAFLTENNVN